VISRSSFAAGRSRAGVAVLPVRSWVRRSPGVAMPAAGPAKRFSSSSASALDEQPTSEEDISNLLRASLGADAVIRVNDTSGGCGSFFQIYVEAESFRGKKLFQQHKAVNDALGSIMGKIHGVTIKTATPQPPQ
jgi:stress-induced morphogen